MKEKLQKLYEEYDLKWDRTTEELSKALQELPYTVPPPEPLTTKWIILSTIKKDLSVLLDDVNEM